MEREGSDVTVFDEGPPGAGSIHAAGIIEPTTAYRTNTVGFLRRVLRLWRNGTCSYRSADPRWLLESLHQLERAPIAGADAVLEEFARSSIGQYRALAEQADDFGYAEHGLVEQFDDPTHFAEERDLANARRATVAVEVWADRGAGALFYPNVGWLHTERFVARIVRELPRSRFVRRRVERVTLDGSVIAGPASGRFDAVVACSGVSCRRLGVPLTGVRGYGWHGRTRAKFDRATIYVDHGLAVAPLVDESKVTGGWDFDFALRPARAAHVRATAERIVGLEGVSDFQQGARPCTPDGLPTVGRRERLVVSTGGFRLGWSFGPALGRHAARLALAQEANDPFLARFCTSLHSGTL